MQKRKLLAFMGIALVLIALVPCPVLAQEAHQADDDPVIKITQFDTSEFPVVTAYISITDSKGEPLAVDAERLVIRENGEIIEPGEILGVGEVGPLTTILAIDTSGSMLHGNKLKIAKNVAADYVSKMGEDDRLGIITFSEIVRYYQEITEDEDTLNDAIENIQATGDTALYDASLLAVEILNPLPGRKAVILLTDGMDNRSESTPEEVEESIGQIGLTISTIGFGDPNQGTGNLTALDEESLMDLADQAGGQYGYAEDEKSLQKLYDYYNRLLHSEYAISYTSPSALRDGLRRNLTVTIEEGSKAGGSILVESSYNPGGLVPEVGGGVPWLMFFLLLGFLLIILFIPFGLKLYKQKRPKNSRVKLAGAEKAPTRIKLE